MTDALGSRYYAEYRTDSGRDALSQDHDLGDGPAALGVRILREDPSRRNGSYVLDATPSGAGEPLDYDNDLTDGRTLRTVTGTVSSTNITVNVTDNGKSSSFSASVSLPSGTGPFPAVVVCPAALKLNWARECERWLPHRGVALIEGRMAVAPTADITILNYEIVAAHRDTLGRLKPRAQIRAVLADGRAVYVASDSLSISGRTRANVAKLDVTRTRPPLWRQNAADQITALALSPEVRLCTPGSIERAPGKAVRVVDRRPRQ